MFKSKLIKSLITHRKVFKHKFRELNVENVQKPRENFDLNESVLTDSHGRFHDYLRISLTEKCNLRCQYCMPEEGVKLTENSKLLTSNEIIQLAELFVEQGVRKIRLTGGEPTIRKDLIEIIQKLKNIPKLENVAITTNGLVLTKKLVELQRAGLDSLNISLDTLDPKKYEQITRRKGLERVLMGIDLALQLNYSPVKINCVIIKNFNDDEILNFVRMSESKNVDVRFIEYMPFCGNKWEFNKMVPYDVMLEKIKEKFPQLQKVKNEPNDTSKSWKIPGFVGKIGFITSMSNMFCNSCNRLRITADGNLKVCLFGNKEFSLRDAIRNGLSGNELKSLISSAVKKKEKQHGGMLKLSQTENRPMILIGEFRKCRFSTLSHVDIDGKAEMVDISRKNPTFRRAIAKGRIHVGPEVLKLIIENNIKKGDVLNVSKLAGIMAAKKTSQLIPLCHNINLENVKIDLSLDKENSTVIIEGTVECEGKTGVEMEALMGVSIAALTIYDMCKSVNKNMVISDIKLIRKLGGKSGDIGGTITVKNYEDIELKQKTVFLGGI